jgi:hypothetical protein
MRTFWVVFAVAVGAALLAPIATADRPVVVSGGGTGTFAADLDGDGDIDGSHFGLGVVFSGGSMRGHFECQMAGNTDILGLPLMAVEGKVSGESANLGAGTAMLTGRATVNLANGTKFTNVEYKVQLVAGGPGVGSLQLTVIGAFAGVPGDTDLTNGNYDLPVETVATGQIRIG